MHGPILRDVSVLEDAPALADIVGGDRLDDVLGIGEPSGGRLDGRDIDTAVQSGESTRPCGHLAVNTKNRIVHSQNSCGQ